MINKSLYDKIFFIGEKMLLIDLLTNNCNRFPHNLKVIKGTNYLKTAPLYDNEMLGENAKPFIKTII